MDVELSEQGVIRKMFLDSGRNDGQTSGLAVWFMRHALLLPVIVIASYYIGRGLGDSLQLLYLLCGIYALRSMDFGQHRTVLSLLGLMLAVFFISVVYPEFSIISLKYWVLYALSGLVLILTVGAYNPDRQSREYPLMAWVPVALLCGFAIEQGHLFFFVDDFHPASQINGMNLAVLVPLVLLFQWRGKYLAPVQYALFYLLSLICLLFADSRTELLMLLLGGAFFLAIDRKRLVLLFVLAPLVLLVTVVANGYLFSAEKLHISGDTIHWLDQLSSRRLSIWSEALGHPPENYWTGVGMHRSMEFLPQLDYVKHLHNLFIEIWYETGFLGLLAYLSLIVVLLSGFFRAYRTLDGEARRIYAVFFASGMAALIAGVLDKGYLHPLTRYYMLFCFTVLYLYHRRCDRADS